MTTFTEATSTLSDRKKIHLLAKESFYATYTPILSPEQLEYMFDMMYSLENISKQMEELHHRYFIVSHSGKDVGYISLERIESQLFMLQKIYLIPAAQGLGIGGKMMDFAKEFVKKEKGEGVAQLELHVNRGNKAQNFYSKMGFTIKLSDDFDIGNGYLMNDYIMVTEIG